MTDNTDVRAQFESANGSAFMKLLGPNALVARHAKRIKDRDIYAAAADRALYLSEAIRSSFGIGEG